MNTEERNRDATAMDAETETRRPPPLPELLQELALLDSTAFSEWITMTSRLHLNLRGCMERAFLLLMKHVRKRRWLFDFDAEHGWHTLLMRGGTDVYIHQYCIVSKEDNNLDLVGMLLDPEEFFVYSCLAVYREALLEERREHKRKERMSKNNPQDETPVRQ